MTPFVFGILVGVGGMLALMAFCTVLVLLMVMNGKPWVDTGYTEDDSYELPSMWSSTTITTTRPENPEPAAITEEMATAIMLGVDPDVKYNVH